MDPEKLILTVGRLLAAFAALLWSAKRVERNQAKAIDILSRSKNMQERTQTLLDREDAILSRWEAVVARLEGIADQLENRDRQ